MLLVIKATDVISRFRTDEGRNDELLIRIEE